MKTRILFLVTLGLSFPGFFTSCTKSTLPDGLECTILEEPSRFPVMNDQVALVYEVKVKNSSIDSYVIESLVVADGREIILDLSGNELDTIISVYHSTEKTLNAGETAFLFLWVEPKMGLEFPKELSQTIQFSRISDGQSFTSEMNVKVDEREPVMVSLPLKARRYATPGAPSNDSYHRRTINFLDEKFWTSQRYAVDFIGLDAGQRYRQGRQNENIDYYGFGDIVYSGTAGEIVSIIDTIPDNIPPSVPVIEPSALYRAGGNQVVVKVSPGVYVFYGHLSRASTNLRVGDRVEIGQPVGLLGNSGNSDAPQLHFQVMDGPDPLRSNGVPWVFDQFILHGNITGYDYINGMIRVDYLTIQKEIMDKNFKGDVVVGIE